MDNQEEQKTRHGGRPTKPDEELAWPRKSKPPSSHLLDDGKVKIPKRYQAIFVLLQDERTVLSTVLTRDDLDTLPATKLLPKHEKDLLYSYWPRWTSDAAEMKAIALLRKEHAEVAGKAQRVADIIERREGFDNLALQEQMRVTSTVLDKQIQHAALIVASTSVEDLEVGETAKLSTMLFKQRVGYVKDLAYTRSVLNDLAKRLEEKAKDDFLNGEDQDEMNAILLAANKVIERKAPR